MKRGEGLVSIFKRTSNPWAWHRDGPMGDKKYFTDFREYSENLFITSWCGNLRHIVSKTTSNSKVILYIIYKPMCICNCSMESPTRSRHGNVDLRRSERVYILNYVLAGLQTLDGQIQLHVL